MKNTIDLILALADKDINIYIENGKLKVNAPGGVLDNEVIEKIKTHKIELIDYLCRTADKITLEIPQAPVAASYPLSSSQHRLWILSQFGEGNIAYNMSGAFVFEGMLNRDALAFCFNRLIHRHEI